MSGTRVGLVGYCSPTGLGSLHRRMWQSLPLVKWLVWPHAKHGHHGRERLPESDGDREIIFADERATKAPLFAERQLGSFLSGLDVVVCVEKTFPDDLFARCRARRIRTVLLVHPEWAAPDRSAFQSADVLVAQTKDGLRFLTTLPNRPMGKEIVYVPAPMPLDELPVRSFAPPVVASRFVFSNGWGGVFDRKGWPTVRDALLSSDAVRSRLSVFSQSNLLNPPPGADMRGAVDEPRDLYADFDVAVAPSRFEGLGLAYLEAMACGLPVVSTDAMPMNEYMISALGQERAERYLLRVAEVRKVALWRPWPSHVVSGTELVRAIEGLVDVDVTEDAKDCRAYIERVHGTPAWERLWTAITGCESADQRLWDRVLAGAGPR